MARSSTSDPSPAQQGAVALLLALLAWMAMALQEVFLFARVTPYGDPYVVHWDRYFWYALLYNLLGAALVSLPFQLHWQLRRHPPSPEATARWHAAHRAALLLLVTLDHLDNEVMRFMGTHFTLSLASTYRHLGGWGRGNLDAIAGDPGGPWLSLLLLAAVPLVTWHLGGRLVRAMVLTPPRWPAIAAWGAMAIPLGVPLGVYLISGGHFRRARIRPALLTLVQEAMNRPVAASRPPALDEMVRTFRADWLRESGDSAWRFDTDSLAPLWRHPLDDVAPDDGERWNVLVLQLESFRGWNVGHLHADPRGSATPFLDSLATSPTGATWTRHLTFGPPTVSGMIAWHCSIKPHATLNITTTFTYAGLACLPAMLRARGWRTAYFTGSDPDWDNQTLWLRQWYDAVVFDRGAAEADRAVFAAVAPRLRALGRAGPFFATVVSITNHFPFRSRDSALDLTRAPAPAEAIRNTMHYTDAAVRELVESLRDEPWFARTLLVIVGDHGYNLGEHDGTAGQRNGWRESVWTPLVMVGAHPRLRAGRHDEVASLLDVAPTLADLLGVRQPVPWLGRSLLHPPGPGRTISMVREDALYAEDDRYGLVLDPATGTPLLYDVLTDPLQQHDLAGRHPEVVARLVARARRDQQLNDYLVAANRVVPPRP